MDERGSGARAPRQPMMKRRTSSLERQQNFSRVIEVEDEDGRFGLRRRLLLLPLEASMFFSHFPL